MKPIKLTRPFEPSDEECDRILGAYLRAWEQIDMAIQAIFEKLLDANIAASYIVINGVTDMGARRQIIEALGNVRLKKGDQTKLFNLMESAQGAAKRRNRIVHGKWTGWIQIHSDKATGQERARTATWVRGYSPVDISRVESIVKDQKVRKEYHYNVQQITNMTAAARKLSRELKAFAESVSLLPYTPPQPKDWPDPPPGSV